MKREAIRLAMLDDLERSGLDEADAKLLRLAARGSHDYAPPGVVPVPRYDIPYFDLDGRVSSEGRARYLRKVRNKGNPKKVIRYGQPTDSKPAAYFPPYLDWRKHLNPANKEQRRVVITEGEKKAAKACKEGIPTVSVQGIASWQSKKRGIALTSELKQIAHSGARIEIAFDFCERTEPGSATDMGNQLALALCTECPDADVWIRSLPEDLPKLDDFLTERSVAEYEALPARPFDPKAQIAALRLKKLADRERRERISHIVMQTGLARGTYYVADDVPCYFDREERRLLLLDDHRNAELRAYMVDLFGINPAEHEWRFVFEELHAYALRNGPKTQAYLFAHYDSARRVLYLNAGGQRLFRISEKSYKRLPNGTDGVMFRTTNMVEVPPIRKNKGSRKAFERVIGVPNFKGGDVLKPQQQRHLWTLFVLAMCFPELMRTRPILLFTGPKGATKSTSGKVVGKSLFGSTFEVSTVEADRIADVLAALTNRHMTVLDNLDGNVPTLRNHLAIASTGGVVERRVLYTTNTNRSYRLLSFVVATSRQPDTFARDDIRDRTLILQLERRQEFAPESVLLDECESGRAAFWRYLLTSLKHVLRRLRNHTPGSTKHRLADFADFATVAGPAVGISSKEVLAALEAAEKERNAFATRSSTLFESIELFVRESYKEGQELTSADLLSAVAKEWPVGEHHFPFKRANTFRALLNFEWVTRHEG